MKRHVIYAVSWALAVAVAIAVGVAAVRTVGDTVRGRGLLGSEIARENVAGGRADRPDRPDPDATLVVREITDEFGAFVVACQGVHALGRDAQADEAAGWRVVSFEPGPDDDVDAVFRNRRRSVEIEVFCSRGQPTVAEVEYNRLPDDD